jgi:RimJ/RimL family protein N-acetyltransferase
VKLSLRPVTIANRGDLGAIDAGPDQRRWVHFGWYWHQRSLENPAIQFRLVHLEGVEAAVGMVAFGPAYADEALTERRPGDYELHHVVIDERHQRRGVGRVVALAVMRMLAAEPDCVRVLAAHHPANLTSRAFFSSLGFRETGERNYDGDPVLSIAPAQVAALPLDSVSAPER